MASANILRQCQMLLSNIPCSVTHSTSCKHWSQLHLLQRMDKLRSRIALQTHSHVHMNGLQDISICFMVHYQWQEVWHLQCVCIQKSDGQTLERFTGMCVCMYKMATAWRWPIMFTKWQDYECVEFLSPFTHHRVNSVHLSVSHTHTQVCARAHTHTYAHLRCCIINISSTMKSNEIRMEEMDNTSEPLWPVKITTLPVGLNS